MISKTQDFGTYDISEQQRLRQLLHQNLHCSYTHSMDTDEDSDPNLDF